MSYTGGMASTFAQRHTRATDAALEAGAQELINGLKDTKPLGLAKGYTTGDFVTGNLLASILATDPYTSAGTRHISVYTDLMYAVYWEYGHYNIFVGGAIGSNGGNFSAGLQREERWVPTMHRKSDDVAAAYARVYKRFME
jgi:hypothetical protein